MTTPDERLDQLTKEALEEFAQEHEVEERQPGDLDANQILTRLGVSFSTARLRMKASVDSGEWIELSTINSEGKRCNIIRKKE